MNADPKYMERINKMVRKGFSAQEALMSLTISELRFDGDIFGIFD